MLLKSIKERLAESLMHSSLETRRWRPFGATIFLPTLYHANVTCWILCHTNATKTMWMHSSYVSTHKASCDIRPSHVNSGVYISLITPIPQRWSKYIAQFRRCMCVHLTYCTTGRFFSQDHVPMRHIRLSPWKKYSLNKCTNQVTLNSRTRYLCF